MAEVLKNNDRLIFLDLGILFIISIANNKITANGVISIAKSLTKENNKVLIDLNLDENEAMNAGAKEIAESLKKNDTLRRLSLSIKWFLM
jgi:hypothetical protein